MKMKKYLIALGVSALLLTGCGKQESRSEAYARAVWEEQAADAMRDIDLSSYLVTSDMKVQNSSGLYYVTGRITNTYNEKIEKIGDIVFFDASGSVIRVKKIRVKLAAGETMYFEELVGEPKNTPKPTKAILTDF